MKNKKIIIIFIVVLVLSIGILLYIKNKNNTAKVSLPAQTPNQISTADITAKKVTPPAATDNTDNNKVSFPLKLGSTGKAVKMMQVLFEVPLTGKFDNATLYQCQQQNGGNDVTVQEFINWITPSSDQFPVQKGSTGELTQFVQILCGADVDGNFGSKTEAALQQVSGQTYINSYYSFFSLVSAVLGININYNNQSAATELTNAFNFSGGLIF
ncbi:MAG: hypothetical protein JST29_05515 [Bacteroidetes bacterium]|nr:hypothetical protein [Bacteroidota bacterium]